MKKYLMPINVLSIEGLSQILKGARIKICFIILMPLYHSMGPNLMLYYMVVELQEVAMCMSMNFCLDGKA
jgi:hypothetical protein